MGVINDIFMLSSEIDRLAREIQVLREEADRQIGSRVAEINAAIEEVHELNKTIARELMLSGNAAASEEQRDRTIESISSILDIRVTYQSNGYAHIATVGGETLLDNDLRRVVYDSGGQVDTTSQFQAITVHKIDKTTGEPIGPGRDLGNSIRSGELRALIEMRDIELPEIASMLGGLSASIVDQFNAVHNEYSAVPPTNSLVGRDVGAIATDPHGFSGQATFAVLDSNNEISNSITIDFDGGGYTTLDDVISAVNAGLGGAGTLALTDGALTFAAAAGTDGVVIAQDPSNPSDRGGRGFSHFFGMNDLLETRVPVNFDTGLSGSDSHGFGASGTVNIELVGPGGQAPASYTLDFSTAGSDIDALITELNSNLGGIVTLSLDANGRIQIDKAAGYNDFDIHVSNDSSRRGTSGVNFTEFFGIGERMTMDAARDLTVRSDIMSDSTRLSLAQLDLSAPPGTPALTVGDNRGAVAFHELQNQSFDFDPHGDLPALTTTIAGYTSYFLSTVAMESANASGLSEDRTALQMELMSRRDSEAGVNLDEELANMIIYQNSYNAAARMISTVNELFDTLLTVGR
jgi:flagellar hook-associated protein 1 FlgK